MAAQRGRNMLIKISDGTSPATFTNIAGLRSKTMTVNNETVDITTSEEAPWRELLANTGMRNVSLSGSGIFKDDAGANDVEDLALNGGEQEFQLVFENGDILQGLFVIASFEWTGEHTDALNFSATFESASIVTMSRA